MKNKSFVTLDNLEIIINNLMTELTEISETYAYKDPEDNTLYIYLTGIGNTGVPDCKITAKQPSNVIPEPLNKVFCIQWYKDWWSDNLKINIEKENWEFDEPMPFERKLDYQEVIQNIINYWFKRILKKVISLTEENN